MRVLSLVLVLTAVGCSGGRTRPPGPGPEYERPEVEPWDSGTSADPLDNVEGEEVTDEPQAPADAGKTRAGDAGARDAAG
jgi:hypothetical protein